MLVLLLGTVLSDGLPVFQERGFVIGNCPVVVRRHLGRHRELRRGTRRASPDGSPACSSFLGLLALVVWLAAKRRWKALIWLVVAVLGAHRRGGAGRHERLPHVVALADPRTGRREPGHLRHHRAGDLHRRRSRSRSGVATAIYLEEYAPPNRFTNFIRLNIRNLAGVPSVVYGLLGLALFVQFLGTDAGDIPVIGGLITDVFGEGGLTGGKTVDRRRARARHPRAPDRDHHVVGGDPRGAAVAAGRRVRRRRHQVGGDEEPRAARTRSSGILTGTILSLSRAIGETAPLILVGAFYGTFFTTGSSGFFEKFDTTYTALPQVVYQWVGEPQDEFRVSLAAAAVMVLLVITLFANLTAVLLRNRYEKRW